jgi:hypothetical protein
MATVDLATGINDGKHPSRHGATNVPYVVEADLNLATALASKGSALAAADVLQVIDVPAETMIMNAGIEVKTVTDGSTLTVDLGTGADADNFVDGFDCDSGTAAGTYAQNAAAFQPIIIGSTADTIDVTLATLSGGAVTTGVNETSAPGIAAFNASV